MNLLIAAMSSATGSSEVCRHAYNLVRCAAIRTEIERITVAIGKWQTPHFHSSFPTKDKKISVVSVDIANDAFARSLWHLNDLPKLANDAAADVVHLSAPVPIRRRDLRCPVVVSLHNFSPCDDADTFGFPKSFFNRVFLHQCLKEADSVACVSETVLSNLRKCFPRLTHRKALVVHAGTTILSSESIALACVQSQFLLMVTEHQANSNAQVTLSAFEELLQKKILSSETLLILVGDRGPETASIRQIIKFRGLTKNVKLIAGVTDGELRWLYENCELLLAPSLTEGFSLPIVEGLLCGSRVVCSDLPAHRDIGGDACHYFDLHAQSTSAMPDAIIKALTESGKPARRLDRFSPEHAAEQYAALYAQLSNDLRRVNAQGEN